MLDYGAEIWGKKEKVKILEERFEMGTGNGQ